MKNFTPQLLAINTVAVFVAGAGKTPQSGPRYSSTERRIRQEPTWRIEGIIMRSRALLGVFGWVVLSSRITVLAQQLPQTVYAWPMGSASQNVMMASLAGIVNRNTNGEVLLSPNSGALPNPRFWLDQLRLSYPQVAVAVPKQPHLFRQSIPDYA
jgi:hypothetical protein